MVPKLRLPHIFKFPKSQLIEQYFALLKNLNGKSINLNDDFNTFKRNHIIYHIYQMSERITVGDILLLEVLNCFFFCFRIKVFMLNFELFC